MKCFTKKIVASLLCLGLLLSLVTGCKKTEPTSSNVSNGADISDVDSDESNIDENTTSDNENVSEEESSATGQTGTTSKSGNTNKPSTTQSTTNSGNINLKGKEILVKSVFDNAFGVWVEPVDPEDETAEQKVMRQWRENFEKKYNCKIKLQQVAANDTQNQMIVKMLSGDKFADVILAQRLDFERIRMAGNLLSDFNKISAVNLSDGGYSKGLSEMYNYGGKQLAVAYSMNSNAQNGFLVNHTLLKKLKTEDPYKLAKEGKWTFEKFFQLLKTATVDNGNGKWDLQDQYGIAWSDITNVAMFKAAGVNIVSQDANGKMKYTMNTAKFRSVADLLVNNIVKTNVCIPANNLNIALRQFCAGKVLLLAQPSYHAGTILATADIDLGWLPIPTEKGGKNYVNIADGWSGAIMVPAANKDLDTAGLLISEYAKIHDDYQKAVREDYTNTTFVNCSDCWDLFGNALVNCTGDFYFPELGNATPWNIMHKVIAGDADYIENLESFEPEIQAWVEDVFNK